MAFGAGIHTPQALDTTASPTFASVTLSGGALTAGGMTVGETGVSRAVWSKYSWTNAMVVALGANLTGDITVATLPAKTLVHAALIVLTGAATGPATLTVALGRVSALYIDYVVALTAKAAANTVYGGVAAQIGTGLTGTPDLPSYTATTAVVAHFIATVSNLDQTVASAGNVYLLTSTLP